MSQPHRPTVLAQIHLWVFNLFPSGRAQTREVPAEFLMLKDVTTWGFGAGLGIKFRREYESEVMGLRPGLITLLILIGYWMLDPPLWGKVELLKQR